MKTFKILLLCFFSITLSTAFTQEKVDEKTKHYFKDLSFENDNYKITLRNIVSKFEYLKFSVKLENKTSDFLIWNTENSEISFDWGKKKPEKAKTLKILPHSSRSVTILVKGGTQMLVEHFSFIQKDVSIVPIDGQSLQAPDFKLPETKNSFELDDFVITLKKSKKKTDETYAKFEVKYTGEDYAIVQPSKISVRVNENDIFANDVKNPKPIILKNGEKRAFTIKFHILKNVTDMQFADMFIQWNKAFTVSSSKKIDGIQTTVILDKEKTALKK